MMEKRIWKKPLAVAEKFMPNEYIAACGDQTVTCQKINADIYDIYIESGLKSEFQHPVLNYPYGDTDITDKVVLNCSTTHLVPAGETMELLQGYKVVDYIGGLTGTSTSVIIWKISDSEYHVINSIVETSKS